MSKRQITLADLARELGISTATVSRALKDYPDISAATKQRVVALAKAWNYRPNSIAAGLRKQESKVIGVIIPEIINHFFSSVIKGIMEVAYELDYRVMLCQSDESYEKEVVDAEALYSSRVDGVMVSLAHGTHTYGHLQEFIDTGIPIVFFDKVPDIDQVSKVVVDDFQGAYQVVNHLIEQGCRHIAHFRGPLLASTSRARYEGYKQALHDHNLLFDESLIYACEGITLEEGQAFAQDLIEKGKTCDAIFCITDSVAMGAMTTLKTHGIKIPAQVAVTGFSDWKMATIIDPPLTSVAQPSLEMGRIATRLLLREIQAKRDHTVAPPETIVLETSLKIRASSCRKG
jgi:LacI family transcriptional regulator